MGEAIFKSAFSAAEHAEFSQRLNQQVNRLHDVLRDPCFNVERPSIGAELEIYLVDRDYQPVAINEQLLALSGHPQLTPELNQYNLEFNMTPVPAGGEPFRKMEIELREFLASLQQHANSIAADIIPIGILPTLQEKHLNQAFMTDRPRYHALNAGLCGLRGLKYHIDINGTDQLHMEGEGVTVEGANTSFQVHLRVPANRFAQMFNAAQITTPLTLALAANSPLIAGKRLWQESRIALFKQSIDFRGHNNSDWRQPARVSFGHGWVREGAWEIFAENVSLFPPLIPLLYDDDEDQAATFPPALPELNLHHGTIWPWNRAVYGVEDGGHLRIEFRSLPAGPTVTDMLANTALAIGWAVGLGEDTARYVSRLPFRFAEYNFYRAAQHGLDARIIWPCRDRGGLEERTITSLIEEFLPAAKSGLAEIGVSAADSDPLLAVIEARLANRQTGAAWQLQRYDAYRRSHNVPDACARMLKDYVERMTAGEPVATW